MTSILIVDDEPNILKLLGFFLKSLGYTVHSAGSGREALDFYERQAGSVDLVISDSIMPELSGRELCRALQGRCPVIIASAMSDADSVAGFLAAGAADFIPKPYALELLKSKLQAVLHKNGKA